MGGTRRVAGKVVNRSSANNPIHLGSLGMNQIVVQSKYVSGLIEEFRLLTHIGVTHGVSSINDAIKTLLLEARQNCPKTALLSYYESKCTC